MSRRPRAPKAAPAASRPAAGNPAGRAEPVVLVTGFEPFGGEAQNPSWELCRRLPRAIAGMRVATCLVPCEFRRAIAVVAAAIERHRIRRSWYASGRPEAAPT